MDNAGDWLYIVFLIIGGVSVFLSSKKEKKQPTIILGHPDGRLELPKEKMAQAKKKTKEGKAAISSPAMEEGGSYVSSYVSPYAKEAAQKTDEPLEKIDLTHAAEARKAFIYSEIFNRKF